MYVIFTLKAVKHGEKHRNKGTARPCVRLQKTAYSESVLPKLISRVSAIPVRISTGFLAETGKF